MSLVFFFNTVFLLADALKNAITCFIIPTVFLTAWTLPLFEIERFKA
ncbi:unnamed protein product [Acanthoscelides obtectus]|uniref:Uncharacterized protein n=1 Tax=Acanthoscelides obtectus TaxID=200917 RepID=A0A9P0JG23_ACAOB|nr:unnamed protein product [Acanthoscelides obtectus]CAK1661591.1 hypothetical protein AOBTE_LOCUS22705 [Acanthoscelides obtectus]